MRILLIIGIMAFSLLVNATSAKILVEKKIINATEKITFDLPEFSSNKQVFLRIKCLQPRSRYGGFLHMMKLMINGQIIKPVRYGKIPVLLDKKEYFIYKNKRIPFFKNGKWLVFYNNNYEKLPAIINLPPEKSYYYTFDITSFLKDSKNKLDIINMWNKRAIKRYKNKLPLELSVSVKPNPGEKPIVFRDVCSKTILAPESSKDWTFSITQNINEPFLRLETWQPRKKFGGFNYPLELKINGKPVNAKLDRLTPVLVNKSNKFVFHGKTRYLNSGAGIWFSVYSPGPGHLLHKYGIKDPEPYTYLFKILPFLKEGKNVITIRNAWTKASEKQYKCKMPLAVKMSLMFLKRTDRKCSQKLISPELKGKLSLKTLPGGAFAINIGKVSLPVNSQFSQPGGGWNYLAADTQVKSASPHWYFKTVKKQKKIDIFAETKVYKLKRRISLNNRRIQVEDTFTNKTTNDIAIRQVNKLNFSGYHFPVCRMGGQPSHSTNNFFSAANSTMFLPAVKSSVGWVMEDDVLRNHGKMFYRAKEKEFGIADDFFALAARKSYTVKWSLYLLPSEDYFDFINRVRNDWGSNFTIPGPFYFINASAVFKSSPEQLRKLVEINKAKYISFWELRARSSPAVNNITVYAYGNALWASIMEKSRKEAVAAISKLHALDLGVKATAYIHCFFNGFEKPDDQTFKDSWIIGYNGKRNQSVYNKKTVFPFQTVYPTWNNTFGKLFRKSLKFYLQTLKVDWFYWDESNGPGATAKNNKGTSNITFNAWDGNSAVVNPVTNQIDKKFAVLSLISQDIFKYAIKKIYAKPGGLILFNGPATTSYRIKTLCMTESQDHIVRCYTTHLNTPLAYGFGTPKFSAIVERLNYGCLYVRTHLNYNCDAVTKFYPFTPIELHKGWVKGKERIITNKSGRFGWNGSFKARIWSYDKNGKKLISDPPINTYNNHAKIIVSEGGLSILEKMK